MRGAASFEAVDINHDKITVPNTLHFMICLPRVVGLTCIQAALTVKPVKLLDRTEMRKTDCFGKTRLVPHVPSSS
jgi:hypothetical protein